MSQLLQYIPLIYFSLFHFIYLKDYKAEHARETQRITLNFNITTHKWKKTSYSSQLNKGEELKHDSHIP